MIYRASRVEYAINETCKFLWKPGIFYPYRRNSQWFYFKDLISGKIPRFSFQSNKAEIFTPQPLQVMHGFMIVIASAPTEPVSTIVEVTGQT